jgi:phosphoenolpyruvate carboxykinase (ATP)
VFGFGVPASVPGVPTSILTPRNTWSDGEAYDEKANRLADMFVANFEAFREGTAADVLAAAPKARATS